MDKKTAYYKMLNSCKEMCLFLKHKGYLSNGLYRTLDYLTFDELKKVYLILIEKKEKEVLKYDRVCRKFIDRTDRIYSLFDTVNTDYKSMF